MTADEGGSRLARWRGVLGLAVHRVRARLRSRSIWLSVSGVALPVALMILVTSVSLGLATQSTVQSENVDYWITPEKASTSTKAVAVGSSSLGNVHAATATIRRHDRVAGATPVLLQLLRVTAPATNTTEYVLALGVIPSRGIDEVSGVSVRGLQAGDPYYQNGTYNGTWTGEVVLSSAASELLGVTRGSQLRPAGRQSEVGRRPLRVTGVSATEVRTGFGDVPILVMHLSELQALTGTTRYDQASQLLVRTRDEGVTSFLTRIVPGTDAGLKPFLERLYPEASVMTRTGLTSRQVLDADLPLAMSLTSSIVAVVVGTLFLVTMMGLAVVNDRPNLAVLTVLGFSRRARSVLVAMQTLVVTLLGGLLGVGLGAGGIVAINRIVPRYLPVQDLAVAHPLLGVYGLGVAIVIGLLAAPYLFVVSRRTAVLEELAR